MIKIRHGARLRYDEFLLLNYEKKALNDEKNDGLQSLIVLLLLCYRGRECVLPRR